MDIANLRELGFKPEVDVPSLIWLLGEKDPKAALVPERAAAKQAPASAPKQKSSVGKQKQLSENASVAAVLVPREAPGPRASGAVTILPAGEALPQVEDGNSFTCLSYNVLLPNSKDGWWIYKYYRDPHQNTSWPERQALLKKQILTARPDIVCLQEVSELSFTEDFSFLVEAGYEALMHEKKGRMRPATFWRSDFWESCCAQHKDRTLTIGLKRRGEAAGAARTLFVVNAHLAAGPSADRRLRQIHEALETVGKDAKKLGLDPAAVPVVVCGDFNSMGATAVRELLTRGEVGPDFRETGDPTEKGQEGVQITSKVKRHSLGLFTDAADAAFGEGQVPATIVAENIDSKMLHDDGSPTDALVSAVKSAFRSCCSEGRTTMLKDDVERYLLSVNRELGRGSEYRCCMSVFERRGEEVMDENDFLQLYLQELAEGKFWGVEHDLRVLGGTGLAVPSDGPCELRFDYIYFTTSALRLMGVQEPLSAEQRQRIWDDPWEVLPNAWHPSDHLPVAAAFSFA